jgi:hypothetical protein
MKVMLMIAVATVFGLGTLLMNSGARAEVVCNGDTCWHAHGDYHYPSGVVVHHDDRWHWGHAEHYRWREHEGRGYWREGVWVPF